jgi:hypothetical protein
MIADDMTYCQIEASSTLCSEWAQCSRLSDAHHHRPHDQVDTKTCHAPGHCDRPCGSGAGVQKVKSSKMRFITKLELGQFRKPSSVETRTSAWAAPGSATARKCKQGASEGARSLDTGAPATQEDGSHRLRMPTGIQILPESESLAAALV